MYFMAEYIFEERRYLCSKALPKLAASSLGDTQTTTSADPDLEEMERLPCLAILIRHLPVQKAAVVETSKLKDLSPARTCCPWQCGLVVGICLTRPRITDQSRSFLNRLPLHLEPQ